MIRLVFVLALLALVGCAAQAPAATPEPSAVAVAPTPTSEPSPTALPTATAAPTTTPTPSPTPEPTIAARDAEFGRPAFARGLITERPLVVMLDNHPQAYPQTGLDEAALVFEALAEYGITRFMAIYTPEIAPVLGNIGPVRSTRLYFVQWALALHGVYAHAGGSPAGLERLAADNNAELINLDALEADHEVTFFRRDYSRLAPHNLYTSQAEIERFLAERIDLPTPDLSDVGYLFAGDEPERALDDPINRFGYFFLYSDDPVSWAYDNSSNRYWRFRRGAPHIDAVSGDQLWFKSVVVMEVEEAPIPGDPKARIDQVVIGSGPARTFMNGTQVAAEWRKDGETGQLRFYDETGAELVFPAGPLWVAAVPSMNNLWAEP